MYTKFFRYRIKVIKNSFDLKSNIINNDNEYIFNLYSMATMSLFHGFRIYKAHNCMSFVSKILKLSKSVNMTKKYYKYRNELFVVPFYFIILILPFSLNASNDLVQELYFIL